MDPLSREQRSRLMASVKGKNTGLEKRLRSALWAKGIRGYRINFRMLGTPDIFFQNCRLAIFVDGCFWHKCPICYSEPNTNREYWAKKVEENVKRDRLVDKNLRDSGYKVVRIWEHEIKDSLDEVVRRITIQLKICRHITIKTNR